MNLLIFFVSEAGDAAFELYGSLKHETLVL